MELPENIEVFETKKSLFWIEPDGILCTISKKKSPKLSSEDDVMGLDGFYEFVGRKKRCILLDAKNARPNTAQERKETAVMLPKILKALAVIVHNPLGEMVVNLFVGLEKPSYPMKVFKPGEEQEAREWLRTYL